MNRLLIASCFLFIGLFSSYGQLSEVSSTIVPGPSVNGTQKLTASLVPNDLQDLGTVSVLVMDSSGNPILEIVKTAGQLAGENLISGNTVNIPLLDYDQGFNYRIRIITQTSSGAYLPESTIQFP